MELQRTEVDNYIETPSINVFKRYLLKNVVSIIQVSDRRIPFVEIKGYPNFPPATSHIGNSLSKTSVISIEYYGPDGHLKHVLGRFSNKTMRVYPKDYNWLISVIHVSSLKVCAGFPLMFL